MTKQTQIELAKYISSYIEINNNGYYSSEGIFNAIECFYSDYKHAFIKKVPLDQNWDLL